MSSSTLTSSSIPSLTTDVLYPAQSAILPYTQGLSGVNLWLNSITSDALYGSLALIFILILAVRATQFIGSRVRLLATLNATEEQQLFWTYNNSFWSRIKKNLLLAPLIYKRHNKEIQLSTVVSIGTIPSRLHTLFLAFYFLSNLLYCSLLDYHHQPRPALLAEARGRTAHLAVMNMLPLFLFSARNNPFIPILGISFDTFNLFHRWIGRIVVLEGLAHTFIWGANNYDAVGLEALTKHLRGDIFLIYGLIGTAAMVAILIQSLSFIRHAFYESFLHLHQILAVAAVAGILLHCESQALPQRPFLYALISLWGFERLVRLCRLFHHRGRVQVEALEGGACRLTFDIPGGWTKRPGSHLYAYIPTVSLWMSHPFSVAWADRHQMENVTWSPTIKSAQTLTSSPSNDSEADFKPYPKNTRITISCIVASRTGMTAALYKKARKSSTGVISLRAFVEGPYGGLEDMRSYGTVLLFAGGVGITHQISHVRDIVQAYSHGTCATRKIILIWSVRTIEQLEWVKPWLEEIIQMPQRGKSLKIAIHVTRSHQHDDDSTILKETGITEHIIFERMNIEKVIATEFRKRVGAMSVGVCGPGGLADDVRAATRDVMSFGNVNFWEESFTW